MADARVDEIKANFTRVGTATTKIGDALTAIAARFTNLLNQITALPTSQQVQDLVDGSRADVAALEAVAESATAMANSSGDPIPIPVPEPLPIPAPVPEGPPVIV